MLHELIWTGNSLLYELLFTKEFYNQMYSKKLTRQQFLNFHIRINVQECVVEVEYDQRDFLGHFQKIKFDYSMKLSKIICLQLRFRWALW